mgnify:FL=1
MPVGSNYVMPKQHETAPLPPDTYTIEIKNIEFKIKTSPFKDENGNPQPDSRQYQIEFAVADEGECQGRTFRTWVNETLRVSTKAKNPTLVEFLKAVTGQDFTVADHEKVTGEFLDSLIGSMLRVNTKVHESTSGAKSTKVSAFLPLRKK